MENVIDGELNNRSRASSTSSNIDRMVENYSSAKNGSLVFSPSLKSQSHARKKTHNKMKNNSSDYAALEELNNFKLGGEISQVSQVSKSKDRAKSPTACNENLYSKSPKTLSIGSGSPNIGSSYKMDSNSHKAREADKKHTKEREQARANKHKC